MGSEVNLALAAAWLALAALLAYVLVIAWRRVMRDGAPLPFFASLRRQGVTPGRIEEVAGAEAMGRAVRRCALCASREDCEQRVAAGDPAPEHCPNAGLVARVLSK